MTDVQFAVLSVNFFLAATFVTQNTRDAVGAICMAVVWLVAAWLA